MTEIISGKIYQRTDFDGAVTRVDRITRDGDIIGHTYVPGGTLSTACVMSIGLFKTRIVPQD